jgi:hypothetical protein
MARVAKATFPQPSGLTLASVLALILAAEMTVPAHFSRVPGWFARQSRIAKDLIVIGLVGLPLYLAAC